MTEKPPDERTNQERADPELERLIKAFEHALSDEAREAFAAELAAREARRTSSGGPSEYPQRVYESLQQPDMRRRVDDVMAASGVASTAPIAGVPDVMFTLPKEGRASVLAEISKHTRYGIDPARPDAILRIDPDGTRTYGHLVEDAFVPEAGAPASLEDVVRSRLGDGTEPIEVDIDRLDEKP